MFTNKTEMNGSYLIDLTDETSIATLKSVYGSISQNGTLRTKVCDMALEEDEFHPLWHTLEMKSVDSGYIKIQVLSFDLETGDLEDESYLWFDITVSKDEVRAICQLSSNVSVILMKRV